ncbi:MAG TPA: hypothetical protein ENG74_01550 [Thermoplasmatales archaeon]|nr:hypothetical protein [Thermoplasmatales archaeon]
MPAFMSIEIKKLAMYPFLSSTREFVRGLNISVEELLTDIAYEKARTFGIERLENAFMKGDVADRKLISEVDFLAEILSYPIARMIATCVQDRYFIKRYALGEAVHASKHLSKESKDFLVFVGKDLGLDVTDDGNTLKLHFIDYLRYAPTRYKKWKLVNRTLEGGWVSLSKEDFTRIIQEVVMKKISNELEGRSCEELVMDTFGREIERFKGMVLAHKKRIERQPVGKISITKLPPCMRMILSAIQSGENVPHMGRFAFVAFLNALGISRGEMLKLFSTAPDFDEERTIYQIDHITGRISSTKYAPPGCDKMKTYGLCPSDRIDNICKRVRNPVSYYYIRLKGEKT